MPLHIGIVGCSAEGAALCYRTICTEGSQWLGPHGHPEVTLHTPSLAAYVACLERHDIAGVGELMLASADKLKAAGADFLICPDNTIHQAFDYVAVRSPLPWLHIADVVATEAKTRGFRQLGITGTHWLVESDVYPAQCDAKGLQWRRPEPAARKRMGQIIMAELVCGITKPESTRYLLSVIEQLAQQDCDAVVLGCTELPLVISAENSPLPTLDSTRLLARAALRKAIAR